MRITLYLDSDVLAYFKERATAPNAAPYQTQINSELRTVMEREQAQEAAQEAVPMFDYMQLLENRRFIAALAEKVAEYTVNKEESVDRLHL